MNRVDRLMGDVWPCCSLTNLWWLKNLLRNFDISVRTVYRDIKALDEIGIPGFVWTQQGILCCSRIFSSACFIHFPRSKLTYIMAALATRFGDKVIASTATALFKNQDCAGPQWKRKIGKTSAAALKWSIPIRQVTIIYPKCSRRLRSNRFTKLNIQMRVSKKPNAK